ncbi:hypothetical protein CHS0354_038624 [Potamilus streckersoni]|uniref:Uncharacterized protein n=1 Tax=Potamilus streckersoni TaxID=2493646 RepID=A0AAE0TFY0_9BIVA|nr:hypothetical protein CHS0354_038624 [Potamilus streckersoni]
MSSDYDTPISDQNDGVNNNEKFDCEHKCYSFYVILTCDSPLFQQKPAEEITVKELSKEECWDRLDEDLFDGSHDHVSGLSETTPQDELTDIVKYGYWHIYEYSSLYMNQFNNAV